MLKVSTRALRFKCHIKMVRETKTAVNRFASKPATKVTANPRIGPVPKTNRKIAETMVVTWVSMIVTKALLKPKSTEDGMVLPSLISSRMRSKISTFESTAIPIVKMTPAMPGKVSVAPNITRAASNRTKFKIKASTALIPEPR